jgi:hypothetical protein
VLAMEPEPSGLLGRCFATELPPQPMILRSRLEKRFLFL